MAEPTPPLENQPNNEAVEIALKVGASMLKDKDYARLGEDDMRNQNIIPKDQTFSGFLMERLGLTSSIQPEAVDRLTSQLPPPQDTLIVNQALERQILTPAEELTIKRGILLREQDDALQDLERASKSEREEFAQMVLDNAGIWKKGNESSFDPEKVRNNPDMIMKILKYRPEAIRMEGEDNRYFALSVPQEKTGGLIGFFGAMMPRADDYVVVTDSARNSELTDYIFSHPNLLRYYTAKELQTIESEKLQTLDQEFGRASIDKYDRIKKELERINFPLRKHAFELLMKDVQEKGEITLITIFRDRPDVAALKGEAPPKTDRLGIESGWQVYKISTEGNNLRIVSDNKKYPLQYYARINSDENRLEYGIKNEKGEIVWGHDDTLRYKEVDGKTITAEWGTSMSEPVLSSIVALASDQRLKYGEAGVQEAQKVTGQLLKTQSSVEFFSKSSEYGISDYPRRQIIVDTGKRLHYVIDQFPTNPPADSRTN